MNRYTAETGLRTPPFPGGSPACRPVTGASGGPA